MVNMTILTCWKEITYCDHRCNLWGQEKKEVGNVRVKKDDGKWPFSATIMKALNS